jgi:predicted TIM-barrel fold metal-dependent hydrolase
MQQYPNLYADVSAITKVLNRDRAYTREFIIRNQDRILFATDAGWWSFGKPKEERELEFTIFERLDLPEDVKEKIYRGNAEKLFGF